MFSVLKLKGFRDQRLEFKIWYFAAPYAALDRMLIYPKLSTNNTVPRSECADLTAPGNNVREDGTPLGFRV